MVYLILGHPVQGFGKLRWEGGGPSPGFLLPGPVGERLMGEGGPSPGFLRPGPVGERIVGEGGPSPGFLHPGPMG